MLSIRNVGGASLFLLGTTFVWMTPALDAVIHLLGCAGVFALLLVPSLERWVDSHVMT